MKLHLLISLTIIISFAGAQTAIQGPSSAMTPFVLPLIPGSTITSIITSSTAIGNAILGGLMDGCGAYENGDGTFTMLINHELVSSSGNVRAHGSTGAYISKWIVDKSSLTVLSGSDQIKNLFIWNGSGYTIYNAVNPSPNGALNRFCSADLPRVQAFYNPATGMGTQTRIFLNGEEAAPEGRAFAHIVSGPFDGDSYQLPHLGRFAWENALANWASGDKTLIGGTDDIYTNGQLYFYIGTKTNAGLDIEKAGLTGGKLYAVKVAGMAMENNSGVPPANTTFSLVELGQVHTISGDSLNKLSVYKGATDFLRTEDAAWDPQDPSDFYVATTNAYGSPSRLWKLHFSDILNPELGGTITAVLDGTEGQQMLDNLAIDNSGHILIQEDPGGVAYLSRIWQYDIATDVLTPIAEHNPAFFTSAGSNYLTNDEESSGIVDVQNVLGPGMFLMVDQSHYNVSDPAVNELGQVMTLFNPSTYSNNPEIDITGNGTAINDGNSVASSNDNTLFGSVNGGSTSVQPFVIENTGMGPLVVTNIVFSGNAAADFSVISPNNFPFTIAAGSSQTISVQFSPSAAGSRAARINITNTDFNEDWYDFVIAGFGGVGAGIEENNLFNEISVFPNPAGNCTLIKWSGGEASVRVYDVTGKEMEVPVKISRDGDACMGKLNTDRLSNGMYFISLESGNYKRITKLLVDH
jgi:hypothetical protein